MIEPNRLSAPGEAAARRRVDVVFAAIDEFTPYTVAPTFLHRRDPDERDRLLGELERAADACGRGALLDDAREAARDTLLANVSGVVTLGTSRVDDRVVTIEAIDDAVSVAVAEDLLEPDDARTLADPGRLLLGLPPLRAGRREPRSPVAPDRSWEPTNAEWADASTDPTAQLPGAHALRVILFGTLAIVLIPTAIASGLTNGQPIMGILIAVAIGAVCWTFGTRHRPG